MTKISEKAVELIQRCIFFIFFPFVIQVNLRHGVPPGETPVTCTASVGTMIIEFGTLSRLTGNPIYEETAMRALRALWYHRSKIGLVGNHIDVLTGKETLKKIDQLYFMTKNNS